MMQAGKIIPKQRTFRTPDLRLHVCVFLCAFAIVVLRRPDALLNPQFWAESGAVWYADAYNHGAFLALFLPQNGYLQTLSRLVAAFVQLFPLSWAPFIFNATAIFIKVLPVSFLVSSRFHRLMPNINDRIFLSLLYLALPNSWEVHANLTNAQWHLALMAFMIVAAEPGSGPLWRCFDITVLILSGLSGPFSLLLVPISALMAWSSREKRSFSLFLIIGTCALVQIACIFFFGRSRSQMALGATGELFLRIFSGQVFLGALIGQKGYAWISSFPGSHVMLYAFAASAGLLMFIYALFKAPLELRLFKIFAAMIFGSALIAPQASDTIPQWQALSLPGVGGRYWFLPMLAFIVTLVWMLRGQSRGWSKIFALPLLMLMLIGIVLDWSQPSFVDFNFRKYTQYLKRSPVGAIVEIPINPPGWHMYLIKR